MNSSDTLLSQHLATVGADLDAGGTADLIAGVAAAPAGSDPQAWHALVAAAPSYQLRHVLDSLLSEARAADHGLNIKPPPLERLEHLRAELKRQGVCGFIIPRSDEHQGEYVAQHSERLAWVTGLTASAGLAIIMIDAAAVFVDGRYILQAEAEVNGDIFERRHLIDEPPTDWIVDNLAKEGKLGYDPWLLTPVQVNRYAAACKQAGGALVPISGDAGAGLPAPHLRLHVQGPGTVPVRREDGRHVLGAPYRLLDYYSSVLLHHGPRYLHLRGRRGHGVRRRGADDSSAVPGQWSFGSYACRDDDAVARALRCA